MPTYALRNRPLTFATAPKGWTSTGTHPNFRHGTVTYDEALPREEMERYELLLIPTEADLEALVAALAQAAREVGWDPAEEEPEGFQAVAGQYLDDVLMFADRLDIARRVFARLRTSSPTPSAV